jgi:hypothetical protein
MAKQTFPRHRIGDLATTLIISLAVVGCGSTNAALSAPAAPAGAVAPTLGSPEQTAIELGNAKLDNNLDRVAPTLGSPEQTALEISPR